MCEKSTMLLFPLLCRYFARTVRCVTLAHSYQADCAPSWTRPSFSLKSPHQHKLISPRRWSFVLSEVVSVTWLTAALWDGQILIPSVKGVIPPPISAAWLCRLMWSDTSAVSADTGLGFAFALLRQVFTASEQSQDSILVWRLLIFKHQMWLQAGGRLDVSCRMIMSLVEPVFVVIQWWKLFASVLLQKNITINVW